MREGTAFPAGLLPTGEASWPDVEVFSTVSHSCLYSRYHRWIHGGRRRRRGKRRRILILL